MTSTLSPSPVSQSERILTLDMLRGIAILGILLMNIGIFAMPWIVSDDPSTLNETGLNYKLWYIVDWIFNGTQRALFSALFGAGIVLFISRQQSKSYGLEPADYFFRRQLWLIMFSAIDVFVLLWTGDILLDYAIIGMMLFVFRNWSPKKLIIAAGVTILLMTARENRDFYEQKSIIKTGEEIAAIDTTKTKLTHLQKEKLEAMQGLKTRSEHANKLKRMHNAIEKVTTSYASVYEFRTNNYTNSLVQYLYFSAWDVITFMLLGMAFYKLGILTGTAPTKTYAWMCVAGLSVGLLLSYFNLQYRIDNKFNWFVYIKTVPFSFYELTRVPRAIGLLGLIMLLYRSNIFAWVFTMLRRVGQMAFTNYLMQSLICGILFNAYGFALYGQLERYQVYLVVLAVWIAQIIYSNIWLHFFLYGPFEWAWRSLTYWSVQPFRKVKSLRADNAG